LPKTPTRKLKVFQTQFGFFDTVLAVSSQAAALRAWGTHRNLFATGDAKLATDEAAIAAALEHPGVPLRRPVGSNDPFALEPTGLPKIPDMPKAAPASLRPPPSKAKPKAEPVRRPSADRSRLNAAEAALGELDERRKREEADLRRQQEELDAKRMAAQQSYVDARKKATAAVVAAREAYRKAGGTS
jgi:type IV secretory pathway VirB10-like protein